MTPRTTLTHIVDPALMTAMSGVMVAPRASQTIVGKSRRPTIGRDISNDLKAIVGTTATPMIKDPEERVLAIVADQIRVTRATQAEAGPVIALTTVIKVSDVSRPDVPIIATRVIDPPMVRDLADPLMIRTEAVVGIQSEILDPRIIGLPGVLTILVSLLKGRGESLYSLHTSSLR